MYVEDLRVDDQPSRGGAVTYVGWLDGAHPYTRGAVSSVVYSQLFEICNRSRILTRGRHWCDFCPEERRDDVTASHGAVTIDVGSGDVLVRGNQTTYLFPDMICHYIAEHEYRPPAEFLDAVMAAEVR